MLNNTLDFWFCLSIINRLLASRIIHIDFCFGLLFHASSLKSFPFKIVTYSKGTQPIISVDSGSFLDLFNTSPNETYPEGGTGCQNE